MIGSAWFTTVARAGLAAVWLLAGATKIGDLAASGRTVNAYRILPYEAATAFGAMLPFIELALGMLLLLGLGTRLAAGISAVLLIGFVVGIAWVWAHGYRIDCGCFGGGGELAANQRPTYLLDLLRDGFFLLLAGFLTARPAGRLAIDNWLQATPMAAGRAEVS
ncbi:MauE/DoxX family redox-associated membrane protein [Micromonospora sp. 050-3]|uniref:MauE/DoxX family redox-associated membrane protein n=1 Tax=Micromonospora sp. 050-3 TaxID=2789265 RepID=UPI003978DF03